MSGFLRRLEKELPYWVSQGWVSTTAQKAILDSVSQKEQRSYSAVFTVALLGILLFTTGVITFFAANWDAIPKLIKLMLLFSTFWITSFFAYYVTTRPNIGKTERIKTLLILLANLLFGANIWLIAQMYHIEAYYPHGVLIWALGALLSAYLLKDKLSFNLSILLGLLWTILFFSVTHATSLHVAYLLLFAAQLIWITPAPNRLSLFLLFFAFFIWIILTSSVIIRGSTGLQTYVLLGIIFFLVGSLLAFHPLLNRLKKSVERVGLLLALIYLFFLTFPSLLPFSWDFLSDLQQKAFYPDPIQTGLVPTLVLICINAALIIVTCLLKKPLEKTTFFGMGLFLGSVILMLSNFISPDFFKQHLSLISLLYNLLFFASTIWIIQLGNQHRDKFLINIGFLFFALGILIRYFDTFWTLLDRSFFFMLGGLLLIGGSYLIEKERRNLTKKLKDSENGFEKGDKTE